MEAHRFDHVTRVLGRATARRRLLSGLALGPIAGLVTPRPAVDVAARRKRKKRKKNKKPKLNAYGCLDVGQPCNGNSGACCSGICEGTKPKKGKKDSSRCVGHDVGTCFPDADSCATGQFVLCDPDNVACVCAQTTGGAAFCGDFTLGRCRECSRDVECEAQFGAGAACVLLDQACSAYCSATGHTACLPRCAGS